MRNKSTRARETPPRACNPVKHFQNKHIFSIRIHPSCGCRVLYEKDMGWKKGEERKKSHFIFIATSRHVWHRALPPLLLLDIRVMHEKPTQATIGWELKESNVPYVKWKILNYMWIYIFLFMDSHSRLSAHIAEVIKRRSRWRLNG